MRLSLLRASPVAVLLAAVASSARADEPPPAPPADPHEVPDFAPPPPPKKHESTFSLMGGLRLGVAFDPGKIAAPKVGPAFDFAGEVGVRFLRFLWGGVQFNGDLFFSPKETDKSISSWLLGTTVGVFTNPNGIGLLPVVGLGYRHVSVTDVSGTSLTGGGVDLLLGLALHLKLTRDVRLLPRVDFATGSINEFAHYLFTVGVSGFFNHDF